MIYPWEAIISCLWSWEAEPSSIISTEKGAVSLIISLSNTRISPRHRSLHTLLPFSFPILAVTDSGSCSIRRVFAICSFSLRIQFWCTSL